MHLSHIPEYLTQNRNEHICVLNGVLLDMEQLNYGICEIGLLTDLLRPKYKIDHDICCNIPWYHKFLRNVTITNARNVLVTKLQGLTREPENKNTDMDLCAELLRIKINNNMLN